MINAIVIMAKAPKPNEVKTRLIPHLKPDMAALLYHNFLLDKIEQVKSIEKAKFFIAYMPDNSENYFKKIPVRNSVKEYLLQEIFSKN